MFEWFISSRGGSKNHELWKVTFFVMVVPILPCNGMNWRVSHIWFVGYIFGKLILQILSPIDQNRKKNWLASCRMWWKLKPWTRFIKFESTLRVLYLMSCRLGHRPLYQSGNEGEIMNGPTTVGGILLKLAKIKSLISVLAFNQKGNVNGPYILTLQKK